MPEPSVTKGNTPTPGTVTKSNIPPELSLHYERHRNGSAKVAITSHVSHDTYADHHSIISGRSIVSSSSIIASQVSDSPLHQSAPNLPRPNRSRESQSRLAHSVVANSSLDHVEMVSSVVLGAAAVGCNLENSIVSSLNGQKPYIEGVNLQGCIVEGTVRLIGPWSLSGSGGISARVHEGEWFRAPRFKVISSDMGISAGLTECVDGKALIDCRCEDTRRWQRSGPRLGQFLGWPAELVREAWVTFEEWLDVPDPQ